ncbi:MAG: 3-deoxy-D-manno-octulosonic acid transferase [Flavobacteriaceae bacterium]|nr:3-deoxy-D-manno-octulosonic acid transferase [Flavobacteriaceae bacterium]
MYFLYNITVYIASFVLKIIAIFNKKIHLFVSGRKNVFPILEKQFSKTDKIIWFHCASLGEFEQGRPVIEKIKSQTLNPKSTFYKHKILVTFFSPSGYEIQKNYAYADAVTYLPFDTKKNTKKFLDIVHPSIAIFVKYEFWPNILKELESRQIKTILVSGIFRSNQFFFKSYGTWLRKSLTAFTYFFVQNKTSKKLLKSIGFTNSTICGDTRFDRVYEITKQDNYLQFIEDFIQNKYILVAGSTWSKDEELLVNYINNYASNDEKFIIAPHNITPNGIENLKKAILKKTTLFSDKNIDNNAQVFIVDTIGILSKIYSYAHVAYIGGGFGKEGIHNILEPATFGIPLVIGSNFNKFLEAIDLVNLKACKVINNDNELKSHLNKLFRDKGYRKSKEKITKEYILKNIGATKIIVNYIHKKI